MEIKRGSLRPYLEAELKMGPEGAEVPIPSLDTATSIQFDMRAKGATVLTLNDIPCVLLDVVTARIRHVWVAGETNHPLGKYDVEFKVIWPGATPELVPSKKFYVVEITESMEGMTL